MGKAAHQPVMVEEVIEGLKVHPDGIYVDGTVGGGGHAKRILEVSPRDVLLLGIDWDPQAIQRARENLKGYEERLILKEGNYRNVREILDSLNIEAVDGILLDLGASYEQLTSGQRGFSLYEDGPLDMRYNPGLSQTAGDLLNRLSERDLKELFQRYGQERWAGRIARAIVRSRPLVSTRQLAELIVRVVPRRKHRIHPATRVFQALRIAVNQELENLEATLEVAANCLKPLGRFCVLTYHSLEDREVKVAFRRLQQQGSGGAHFRVVTPKPIRPMPEELSKNPSARSAKLRILERVC